jgi:predicted RNase H-like HicB family nuclease
VRCNGGRAGKPRRLRSAGGETSRPCRISLVEPRFVLSNYVERALAQARYDKLEDGCFAGRTPPCPGVVAFSDTLRKCEGELRSTLEDWILIGLKLSHALPVIGGIDLNRQVLWNSVDPEDEARCMCLPDWQRRILQDRLADLERNPDDEQPWDQVKKELWPSG